MRDNAGKGQKHGILRQNRAFLGQNQEISEKSRFLETSQNPAQVIFQVQSQKIYEVKRVLLIIYRLKPNKHQKQQEKLR